jgi:CelD/BcsL family acetyltransferase involved in cellulose biosynthesis
VDSSLKIQVFTGRDGLTSLLPQWSELMTQIQRPCFYHHPQWFAAYLNRTDADNRRITFVCVYRQSSLVAVFPTTWERNPKTAYLEVSLPIFEDLYMADCAISDAESPSDIYSFYRSRLDDVIGGKWDIYRAADVLEDSQIARAILKDASVNTTTYANSLCAEIPICDYDLLITGLKKKFRGNLNNARNRLAKAGSAEFSVVKNPEEIGATFREFVELEMSGWKGRPDQPRENFDRPSAIGLKDKKLRFYDDVVRRFCEIGSAEIAVLRLDGKMIGAEICILLNDTSYAIKAAYDEGTGRLSPGHLLIDYACRRYAEDGAIKRYNQVTGYPWFSGWNPEYRKYLVIREFNSTMKGTLACLRSKLGARVRGKGLTA